MQTRSFWLSLGMHGTLLVGAGILGGTLAEPARRARVHFVPAIPVPELAAPAAPRAFAEVEPELPPRELEDPQLPIPRDDFRDLRPEPEEEEPLRLARAVDLTRIAEEAVHRIAPPPVEVVRAQLLDGQNRPPAYPARARRLGFEGDVVLRLHVGVDGAVTQVEIATPSRHRALDRAAVEAAQDWRFAPAMQGEVAVPDIVEKTVRFRLEG